jgi:hypothetical protein
VDLIAIYVEDHLALSLAGVRLARRCRAENAGTDLAAYLDRFIAEVEEDREVLKDVAGALGGARSTVKELLAAAGELAGRLKLNGRLLRYSDPSRLWELEALVAGSDSRRGLWKVLQRIGRKDPRLAGFTFEPLEERARAQREQLERFRVRAAESAFGPSARGRIRAAAAATEGAR